MERYLLVRPREGLANSLRSLSSFIWLAKYTGRNLIIISHTHVLGYTATDFIDFSSIGARCIRIEDPMPNPTCVFSERKNTSLFNNIAPRKILEKFNYFVSNAAPIVSCSENVIYLETSHSLVLSMENYDPNTFAKCMRERYSHMPILPNILSDFACVPLPKDFVVMHIRRNDLIRYKKCAENYDVSKYIKKAKSWKIKSIVLCTDDKKVRKELSDCLTIDVPTSFLGKEALFDFLVISRASFVVGTFHSSFSLEAFYYGSSGKTFTTVGHELAPFHVPSMCVKSKAASHALFFLILLSLPFLIFFVIAFKGVHQKILAPFVVLSSLAMLFICTYITIYDNVSKCVKHIDLESSLELLPINVGQSTKT